MQVPKTIEEWMNLAIENDYLLGFLITSEAEAALPSLGVPYGAGKSTLSFKLSFRRYRMGVSSDEKAWNLVFDHAYYYPHEIETLISPGNKRVDVAIWDDIQETCPISKSGHPEVIQLGADLTTSRTELACLIGTASDLGMIAKPIRIFMKFEIIISRRGIYEFQKIRKMKDYSDPYWNKARLDLKTTGTFTDLEPEVRERYRKWRTEKRMLGGGEVSDKRARDILKKMFPEDLELLTQIFKNGSMQPMSVKQLLKKRPDYNPDGDGPTWNAYAKRLYRLGCISTEGGAYIATPRGKIVLEIQEMLQKNGSQELEA